MVSQCFSVRPCDIHTELIPASQHANQFSPITKDQNKLFYTIKWGLGQHEVLSELPIPSRPTYYLSNPTVVRRS